MIKWYNNIVGNGCNWPGNHDPFKWGIVHTRDQTDKSTDRIGKNRQTRTYMYTNKLHSIYVINIISPVDIVSIHVPPYHPQMNAQISLFSFHENATSFPLFSVRWLYRDKNFYVYLMLLWNNNIIKLILTFIMVIVSWRSWVSSGLHFKF